MWQAFTFMRVTLKIIMWPLNDMRTAWLHYGWPGKRARLLRMATTDISGGKKKNPLHIKGYRWHISWHIWSFLRLSEFPTKLSKTLTPQLVCGLCSDVVKFAAKLRWTRVDGFNVTRLYFFLEKIKQKPW